MKLETVIESITKNMIESSSESKPFTLQSPPLQNRLVNTIDGHTQSLPTEYRQRIESEFLAAGPLNSLINDENITEIMIMAKDQIWYEKHGQFYSSNDYFITELTFHNFIHRLCDEAQIQTSLASPFANGVWQGFRVHLSTSPVSKNFVLTLRRQREVVLELEDLQQSGWCQPAEVLFLKQLLNDKKNIIVVGNTGSGKTTLLNALLRVADKERWISIEDTEEIRLPNKLSTSLLTRQDANHHLPDITATELVRQSLRMRPDRLVVGEVRGAEAKDLLMALSTGHQGSMTSLHAETAEQALLRLEMLIQMGAPQWNLEAIRRLIYFCVHALIITKKEKGRWYLDGVYKIVSQEHFGFTIEKMDAHMTSAKA